MDFAWAVDILRRAAEKQIWLVRGIERHSEATDETGVNSANYGTSCALLFAAFSRRVSRYWWMDRMNELARRYRENKSQIDNALAAFNRAATGSEAHGQ